MRVELFPFRDYWWFYPAFTGFVLVLLAIDLGVFHRKAHRISVREATGWCGVWVALSLVFNFLLYRYAASAFRGSSRLMAIANFDPEKAARETALQFLAGYILEYSLSVDNIFVFIVVFNYFGVQAMHQHRVLFYGILGALVFRGIFIAIGAALIRYHWVVIAFGVFLIFTGARMMFVDEKAVEPEKNPLIRLFRRFVPVTPEFRGQRFFVRHNGIPHATPLLITLLFLEMTDIVFAVDSVPAIFAVTSEPLIVFSSNILAILGLRSLYFMLAGAMDLFHMLKYGLSIVLIFVGLKMTVLNRLYGGQVPITISLGIIAGVIAIAVVLSLVFPKRGASDSG